MGRTARVMVAMKNGKNVKLGKALRNARLAAGLSQAALARACAITEQTVSRAEAGQVLSGRLLFRIARALGLTIRLGEQEVTR